MRAALMKLKKLSHAAEIGLANLGPLIICFINGLVIK